MKNLFELWRSQSWPLHALFGSLFWGGVAGLLMMWPVITTVIPVWAAIVGGVVLSAALSAAKFFKRPGTE